MTKKLTPSDFAWAAKELDCEVAAILAVDRIESRGAGFFPGTTEPTILFERKVFHDQTGGKYSTTANVNISNPVRGGYKGGMTEHLRLQAAEKVDPARASVVKALARKSASWGRFQIMGFNHKLAGHAELQSFINAMYRDERSQLEAFVSFIKNAGLVPFLKRKDWAGFARRYNGKNYAENKYDVKLQEAYEHFKAQEVKKKTVEKEK